MGEATSQAAGVRAGRISPAALTVQEVVNEEVVNELRNAVQVASLSQRERPRNLEGSEMQDVSLLNELVVRDGR